MNGDVQYGLATLAFNNLKVYIAELSDFNGEVSSLDKLYLLQDFFYSTQRHCQGAINSTHSLSTRLHISSHYLATTENIVI